MNWALRRDELCDPGPCADAPDEEGRRCDHCSLGRLDAAQCAEKDLLIRRALDLMSALKLVVQIGIEEIRGDEFCAMLIIAEKRDLLEREKHVSSAQNNQSRCIAANLPIELDT